MKKEHLEVILEDMNSKFDLVFENFQSLRDKIDENKIDSDKRNDETNKLLKFAKEDSDKQNDETNEFLKFAYDDLDKKIQENGLSIKENSKKIENNGTKIEENKKLIKENGNLIEENGKNFETLGEKQHNYEERLILLEKRCC